MAGEAIRILRELDGRLSQRCTLRIIGGASLILAYGFDRATEDVDMILDDSEFQFLVDECNWEHAIEETNRILDSSGLYISHIWDPTQQILTPQWRESCKPIELIQFKNIQLTTIAPIDIAISKLARFDAGDVADVEYLFMNNWLKAREIESAISTAQVPPILREVFSRNAPKLNSLAARF